MELLTADSLNAMFQWCNANSFSHGIIFFSNTEEYSSFAQEMTRLDVVNALRIQRCTEDTFGRISLMFTNGSVLNAILAKNVRCDGLSTNEYQTGTYDTVIGDINYAFRTERVLWDNHSPSKATLVARDSDDCESGVQINDLFKGG